MSTPALLAIAVGGIALLLLMIVKFKVNAFLALLVTSVLVGLVAGIPLATVAAKDGAPEKLGIIPAIIAGMGGTLGSVAILVALGSMLGRIIELSGGAGSLSGRFTELLGPRRVAGALTAAALVLAVPVFFDVGFIILVPIIYGFSQAAGLNPVKFGLPIAGIMLAVHVAVPPHPGVVGGAALLGADVGMLTLLGLLIALPLGVVAHVLSKWLNRRDYPMLASTREMFEAFGGKKVSEINEPTDRPVKQLAPPSAGMILTLIVTPLATNRRRHHGRHPPGGRDHGSQRSELHRRTDLCAAGHGRPRHLLPGCAPRLEPVAHLGHLRIGVCRRRRS